MDSRVYFSPIEDSHIIEYMSRSDDPELMSTTEYRSISNSMQVLANL